MPTVKLSPSFGIGWQGFTSGGLPLNGGLLNTYIAGGTTPQATYTTSAGTVQNANPIVLSSDGRPPSEIWLVTGSSYRFDLTDSLGTLIKTYDNVTGINDVSVSNVPWAIAAGTADVITAAYTTPNTSLTDGLLLSFRASGANTVTTPTFSPDGLTAHTITKTGGTALAVGDIVGNLTEVLVRYNLANTRWELMNTSQIAKTGSSMVLLSSQSASASASLDFSGFFTSAYDQYEIEWTNLLMTTNTASLRGRVSIGGAYKSDASYQYGLLATDAAAGAVGGGASGQTQFLLGSSLNSAQYCSGRIRINGPLGAAAVKQIDWTSTYIDSTGTQKNITAGGSYSAVTTALDGFQLIPSASTIASGTASLYGIRKS